MLSTLNVKEKNGKVDPRVERTRKLLIEAFQSMLAEKSFEEITVQDITAKATVNRATFYAHFPDKYALGNDIMREDFANRMRERSASDLDDYTQYLHALFLTVTDHWVELSTRCKRSYQMFDSLVEPQVKKVLCESILAWLQAHKREHRKTPQQMEMAATIAGWAIFGTAMQWTQIRRTESAEDFAAKVIPLIAGGIG